MAVLIVGGGTLTLIVGLVLVVVAWRAGHQRAIDAELAGLRAEGKPTTPAELDVWYAADPDRPDATGEWLAAFDAVGQFPFNGPVAVMQESLDVGDGRFSLDVIDDGTLRRFVDDHRTVYDAIERATAAGSNVRYPVEYTEGKAFPFHQIQSARDTSRWLGARFALAVREQRFDDAVADIERMFALSATLAKEPTLVGLLIRIALDGETYSRVEDLLVDQPLTADQLDRLGHSLRTLDYRPGVLTALEGERVLVLDILERNDFDDDNDTTLRVYRQTPLVIADRRLALDLFRQMVDAAKAPDMIDMLNEMDAAFDAFQVHTDESVVPPYLARQVIPSLESTAHAAVRSEAVRRVLIAGVAARRYRIRAGSLPTTSDELATALPEGLPVDPFDGQPLRIRVVTDAAGPARSIEGRPLFVPPGPGVAYYSVGRNRVDDGGTIDDAQGYLADFVLFLPETMDPDRLFVSKNALIGDETDATAEDGLETSPDATPD